MSQFFLAHSRLPERLVGLDFNLKPKPNTPSQQSSKKTKTLTIRLTKGNKKLTRDTQKEIEQAIHKTGRGTIGFPVYGFKKGMMECTSFLGDKYFSKKLVSGAVKILNVEDGLIPIDFKKQDVLEHNIAEQTIFSPQFHNWKCELVIMFDENNISAIDICTLLNYAGFYYGIGMWRPKCRDGGSGEYGQYKVKTERVKVQDE